jgi:ABC-2 type transport system permease protein
MDTPFAFSEVLKACMVFMPATLFMLSLAVLLIGYLPRYTSFTYAYLGYAFAAIYLGALMGLPEWLSKLSPFGHIPMLPNDELNTAAIITMLLISAASLVMLVLGFIGYEKRDMKFQ